MPHTQQPPQPPSSPAARHPGRAHSVSVAVSDTAYADRLEVRSQPPPATDAPTDGRTQARAAIERRSFDLAAAGESLGEALTALAPVAATAGWQQLFDAWWLVWHPDRGVRALRRQGPIAALYATLGGPAGELGFPLNDENDTQDQAHAVDFEGGTLVWDGVAVAALTPPDPSAESRWLSVLSDPPGAARQQRGSLTTVRVQAGGRGAVTLGYHHLGAWARSKPSATSAPICAEIERHRELVGVVDGLSSAPAPAGRPIDPRAARRFQGLRHEPSSTPLMPRVTPVEVLRRTGTTLPPQVTAVDLHEAAVDIWHALCGDTAGPASVRTFDGAALTWAGFADHTGLLTFVETLLARAPQARRLLHRVGISVESRGGDAGFVAVDTDHGWLLYGDDAQRYIACDPRLASLLVHIGRGTVGSALLTEGPEPASVNRALAQGAADAQLLTLLAHAGRLPGWSLMPPWTPQLRAAVAHNLHQGCLSGWPVYEHTGGQPVEVVRAMVWDFFCGPAALLAQSYSRFEGELGHGVLAEAARSFPAVEPDDDGHARYIVAGNQRRRVDIPA